MELDLPLEMMQVARVQNLVVSVSKLDTEDRSSVLDRRHSLDDMPVKVHVVVLREVHEVGGSVVVDGDVDAWQLVEAHVVVAH